MTQQRTSTRWIGPVILVEQEWPARAYLKAQLEEDGLWVVALPAPSDAIAYLERWGLTPSLLILDLARQPPEELPLLLDLIHRNRDVPIIVLKSPMVAGQPEVETRAARVLARPFSVDDVVRAVAGVLGG
jgi:DNA-binding response OmpR family regulator